MVKKIINLILVLLLLSSGVQAKGTFEVVGKSTIKHGPLYKLLKLKDDRLLIIDYYQWESKNDVPEIDQYGKMFEIYNLKTKKFEQISQPNIWRERSLAIVLDDGKVFLMGTACSRIGYSAVEDKICKDSLHAEIYDPDTDTYKVVGRLQVPRDSFWTSKLSDGKILISNGSEITFIEKLIPVDPNKTVWQSEIYDPATGQFTMDAETTIKKTKKYAKVYNNWYDYDYFVTHIKDNLKPEYPPGDMRNRFPAPEVTYKEIRLPNEPQMFVNLDNEEILMLNLDYEFSEIYDPKTHKYRRIKVMSKTRTYSPLTYELNDGRILMLWEAWKYVEIFDPKTLQITEVGDIALDARYKKSLLLENGKILFYSGVRFSGGLGKSEYPVNTMLLYDPETNTMKKIDENPKYMFLLKAYQLSDDSIFFLADVREKTIGVIYRNKELIGE